MVTNIGKNEEQWMFREYIPGMDIYRVHLLISAWHQCWGSLIVYFPRTRHFRVMAQQNDTSQNINSCHTFMYKPTLNSTRANHFLVAFSYKANWWHVWDITWGAMSHWFLPLFSIASLRDIRTKHHAWQPVGAQFITAPLSTHANPSRNQPNACI